jgi:mevalonate kinase
MNFYSKILLFGEHTIINEGHALATPLRHYCGTWQILDKAENNLESNKGLKKLAQYLEEHSRKKQLLLPIDIEAFQTQLGKGLYFHSNIPKGYGVGSSGTVCAAVYERFGQNKLPKNQLHPLKKGFAQMESFFHGSSSGIDPLICYSNQSIFFQGKEHFKPVSIPNLPSPYSFFLLDTTLPRSTGPLVQYFQNRLKTPSFRQRVELELMEYNEDVIAALLQKEWAVFEDSFQKISFFQFKYLKPMIPENLHSVWAEGLSGNAFKLKLCGAGGGGFMLGLSKDIEQTQAIVSPFNIIPI